MARRTEADSALETTGEGSGLPMAIRVGMGALSSLLAGSVLYFVYDMTSLQAMHAADVELRSIESAADALARDGLEAEAQGLAYGMSGAGRFKASAVAAVARAARDMGEVGCSQRRFPALAMACPSLAAALAAEQASMPPLLSGSRAAPSAVASATGALVGLADGMRVTAYSMRSHGRVAESIARLLGEGSLVVLASGACLALSLGLVAGMREGRATASRLREARRDAVDGAAGRASAAEALRASEEEYRLAMELNPQIPWVAGPDGRIRRISGRFAALTGSRPGAAVGAGFRAFVHPDDLAAFDAALARSVSTGEAFLAEHRVPAAGGGWFWMLSRAEAERNPDGSVRRWFGSVEDVDARKRMEAALLEGEARFRRAISAARIGTWDHEDGGAIITSPGMAAMLYGMAPCDAGDSWSLGQFLRSVLPADQPAVRGVLAALADEASREGSAGFEFEYRVVAAPGDVRWLSTKGEAVRGPGGRLRVSGATMDVTGRRAAEEALHAAQGELTALNLGLREKVAAEIQAREGAQLRLAQAQRMEALGQLAGGIAHDFNNVLQAVTSTLAMIERKADSGDAVRRMSRLALGAAARGSSITGRLLSFSRQGALQASAIDPKALLAGLREMLLHTLGASLSIELDVASGCAPLFADRDQLETVLVNLAVNSRDAMPGGGVLSISARPETVGPSCAVSFGSSASDPSSLEPGDYVRITVSDDGEGMPPDVLSRASEPFFTTKPHGRGTGLGLAMARGFAEQSMGSFSISSSLGLGTAVSLWFPCAPPGDRSSAAPDGQGVVAAPFPARLLLVDDDLPVRESLAGQLESFGYSVSQSSGGLPALARLDAGEPFDLLVSDYSMPAMDGAVLAGEARARRPGLPVLILTGYADPGLVSAFRGWEGPSAALVRKPVTAVALSLAVARLLPRGGLGAS